jgi:hypothetical protein
VHRRQGQLRAQVDVEVEQRHGGQDRHHRGHDGPDPEAPGTPAIDPEVDLRADGVAVGMGSPERVRGAEAVAGSFSGRARDARPALIDGGPGMVWVVGDRLRVAWEFVVEDGRIVAIDMLADPETLGGLVVTVLDGPAGR